MSEIQYCKMSVTSKLSNLIWQFKHDTFRVQFVFNRDFELLSVKITQIEVVHSLSKLYELWKLAFCYVFIQIELFSCLFSVLNVHSHYICFVKVLYFIILLHDLSNSCWWIVFTYFQSCNFTEFWVSLQAIDLFKSVSILCSIAVLLKCDCTFIKKVNGGETDSTLLLSFDKTLLRHWEVFLNRNPLLLILTT